MTHDPPEVKAEHLPPREALAFDSMTLRDYFAAAALTGLLASHSGEIELPDDDKAAKWSFAFADAMIARRNTSSA